MESLGYSSMECPRRPNKTTEQPLLHMEPTKGPPRALIFFQSGSEWVDMIPNKSVEPSQHLVVARKCVWNPGKWNQRLKPAVPWVYFAPYSFWYVPILAKKHMCDQKYPPSAVNEVGRGGVGVGGGGEWVWVVGGSGCGWWGRVGVGGGGEWVCRSLSCVFGNSFRHSLVPPLLPKTHDRLQKVVKLHGELLLRPYRVTRLVFLQVPLSIGKVCAGRLGGGWWGRVGVGGWVGGVGGRWGVGGGCGWWGEWGWVVEGGVCGELGWVVGGGCCVHQTSKLYRHGL